MTPTKQTAVLKIASARNGMELTRTLKTITPRSISAVQTPMQASQQASPCRQVCEARVSGAIRNRSQVHGYVRLQWKAQMWQRSLSAPRAAIWGKTISQPVRGFGPRFSDILETKLQLGRKVTSGPTRRPCGVYRSEKCVELPMKEAIET